MSLRFIFSFLLIFSFQLSFAQEKKTQDAKTPAEASSPLRRADVISVKAALEDMLVRRYAQELSAIVSFERFNVGARFELNVVDEKAERRAANANDQYTDLELGYLDADTLFDRYANVDAGSVSPLAKYAIKSVMVNVGLHANMGEKIKKEVETWLQNRVKDEFGALGKTQVQFIQSESTNPSRWDRLIQMQGLVGQLILALAILLGVILWRLLSGGSASKTDAQSPSVNIQSKSEMTAGEGLLGGGSAGAEVSQDLVFENKIEHVSEQVKDLAPKIVHQLDQIISQWCDQGEEGLMQIATFAEISGSVLGSLPIPKEHKKKMGDIFAQMSTLTLEKRLDVTNKVYWDLVASLNLGVETLQRPFSFLSNSSVGTVNQVLLGNDVDIQTVVSLYMPDALRKNYFTKLDGSKKVELLNNAAKLSSISQEKLKNIETQIAPYFEEKVSESEVSLSMTLNKLVESMSMTDSCQLLPKVEGPMVDEYKRQNPHLGFFNNWTLTAKETLIKRATNEELIAYVRVVPGMMPTVLELISPRARQILEDDLSREDKLSDVEKERLLQSLNNRLLNLVYSNSVNLDEAIESKDANGELRVAA